MTTFLWLNEIKTETHYSLFHNIVQIEWRTETLKFFPFDSSKHTFKKKGKKRKGKTKKIV